MNDEMIRGLFEAGLRLRWMERADLKVWSNTGRYRNSHVQSEWEGFKRGFEAAYGAAILGLLDLPEPAPSPDPEA